MKYILECDTLRVNIMSDFHTQLQSINRTFDFPIFQKTYEIYKLFYSYLVNFPKKDKYSLGLRCENTLLDFLEEITLAGGVSKTEKLPILQRASTKLDLAKVLIRLCKDLKILDNKKYLTLEASLQEIGRMLGGWIKSSSEK